MPANVGLWGGIACLLGQHVRSRGQAHATPEGWVSRCARCAIPMVRAHGGGKWQVVKTPKGEKSGTKVSSDELLAKAITRSRVAGARKEKKETLAAEKAAVDEAAARRRHVHGGPIEQEEPAERKRRRFGLRRKAAAPLAGEAIASIVDTVPAPKGKKSRLGRFRRKQRGDEAEPIAQDDADLA